MNMNYKAKVWQDDGMWYAKLHLQDNLGSIVSSWMCPDRGFHSKEKALEWAQGKKECVAGRYTPPS